MSTIFEYVEHPLTARHREQGPATTHDAAKQVHGESVIGRFNEKVGLRITLIVGTMWAAYLFAAIAFVSLPSTIRSGSPTELVLWLSSEFIQLVLLPIIIVGQNIQAKAADARAEATYNDASAVLEEAKQIQKHLAAQDEAINRIIDRLEKLKAGA